MLAGAILRGGIAGRSSHGQTRPMVSRMDEPSGWWRVSLIVTDQMPLPDRRLAPVFFPTPPEPIS